MEAAGLGLSHARVLRLERLEGAALRAALPEIARLRCEVFRTWPYLYEGDAGYEARYLDAFASGRGAVVIAAFAREAAGERLVGVATASPLSQHHEEFAEPFRAAGHDVSRWFYCGESVLEEAYRGRGLGVAFFEERERAAREQGFAKVCFCAVRRERDDPRRPAGYEPLDGFWRRRGYRPMRDMTTTFDWREVGDADETPHEMQFWSKTL